MTVAENLAAVKARIARAAEIAGRARESVRLVAVSKTKPESAIREAYAAGQRAFGENYAQELAEKAVALADLADIEWHFIGHLQTNKAKVVAKHAHVIHTLDKTDLVRELGKRLTTENRSLDALIEVNVAGEAQKHGVAPDALGALLTATFAESRLRVRGLMTMPPAEDLDEARRAFDGLHRLQADHGGATRLPELSMGMSDDLEVAIAAGATLVRVGTAIFGSRDVA